MAVSSRIHHAVAQRVSSSLGATDLPDEPEFQRWLTDRLAAPEATGDDRVVYANTVGAGWLVMGFIALLAMLPIAGVGWLVGGRDGAGVGVAIAMFPTFLCVAGSIYAAWRWHYALRARSAEQRGRTDAQSYRRNLERALPRDSSLPVQAVVGLAATVATLINW